MEVWLTQTAVQDVRLPMSENEFQHDRHVEMPRLDDCLRLVEMGTFSPFAELVVFTTIFRDILSHQKRLQSTSKVVDKQADNWASCNRLAEVLQVRLGGLLIKYPSSKTESESLLMFTVMIAHSVTLRLCRSLESMPRRPEDGRAQVAGCKQRALLAAQEISHLSSCIPSISLFKVSVEFPSRFKTHCLPSLFAPTLCIWQWL